MSYDVSIFGIEFTLKPVAFTLPIGGGWDVYWYGIIIATGFLLALIYAYFNYKRFGLNLDRALDVILVTTPVAILCARAYYVLFDGERLESFGAFFGFGDSSGFAGLGIYGGVIGAFVTGFLMCKLRKVKFTDMFDLAALGFLIGQGIGRWGNFVNQEAYGALTGSDWWGMQSDVTIREMGEGLVHPCFLYESIWCLTGFVVIHFLSKKRKFSGEVFLMYLAWYGFGRAIIEPMRTDSLFLGNFKVSFLLAVLLFIASTIAIIVIRKKIKQNGGEYENLFEEGEENKVSEENSDSQEAETLEVEENVQAD